MKPFKEQEKVGVLLSLRVKTYRYRGHSMSDAQHYRTKDEVEEYKKIDPITQVKDIILEKKYATEEDIKAIDKRVKSTCF
jgi:pyruvate dehydrogenase E1 component alpha subunit